MIIAQSLSDTPETPPVDPLYAFFATNAAATPATPQPTPMTPQPSPFFNPYQAQDVADQQARQAQAAAAMQAASKPFYKKPAFLIGAGVGALGLIAIVFAVRR